MEGNVTQYLSTKSRERKKRLNISPELFMLWYNCLRRYMSSSDPSIGGINLTASIICQAISNFVNVGADGKRSPDFLELV